AECEGARRKRRGRVPVCGRAPFDRRFVYMLSAAHRAKTLAEAGREVLPYAFIGKTKNFSNALKFANGSSTGVMVSRAVSTVISVRPRARAMRVSNRLVQ